MIREHECWNLRCKDYVEWNNASIVMMTFPQDMTDYAFMSSRRLFVHSPTAARVEYFFNDDVYLENDQNRSIEYVYFLLLLFIFILFYLLLLLLLF